MIFICLFSAVSFSKMLTLLAVFDHDVKGKYIKNFLVETVENHAIIVVPFSQI